MATLAHLRCSNHGVREAVALCPGCRRPFCRECVTEHENRLLCSGCLTVETSSSAGRGMLGPLLAPLRIIFAVLVLWGVFFVFGWLLLTVPSSFHETPGVHFSPPDLE